MLTGHGSFGSFLHRIGKVDSAECPHCDLEEEDTSDHTIQSCPAWTEDRVALIYTLGPDLALTDVIGTITTNRESWLAFAKFAENVMRAKEDAERAREAALLSPGPFDPG